mgnify:FL=1
MIDLQNKIRNTEKAIREANAVLAEATPHSNKEKDAKRRLEKAKRQLLKLNKELRYAR